MDGMGRAWKWMVAAAIGAAGWLPPALGAEMGPTQAIPVTLTAEGINQAELTALPAGGWEVRTTGGDPFLFSLPLQPVPDLARHHVLAFEYFCASGTDGFQVFWGPPISEARSRKGPGLGVSEGWVGYALDLSESAGWAAPVTALRLDFGNRPGRTIQVRNLALRPPTDRERELAARREAQRAAEQALEARLRAYLAAKPPAVVTRVAVTADEVRVTWDLGGMPAAECVLCELPIEADVTTLADTASTTPLPPTGTSIALPRWRQEGGAAVDRLLSRWILARRTAAGVEAVSQARYADDDAIAARAELPVPRPVSRKGIGGFGVERHDNGSDAEALGIGYVTVNVVLSFMRPGPEGDAIAFDYGGKTYHADRKAIERYDRTMRFCAERGIVVSAIILIPKAGGFAGGLGRIFMHPDCDPSAIFSMPNLTTAEGVAYYAAALSFLAERYSRPDGEHGRIHHWIMHNEVDAGWVWTNAGPKALPLYVDLYHRSMRMAHLIARTYDADAKAFVSLTHHWTWAYDPRFFGSKEVLEVFAAYSRAEGDFDWGIAYHPYPESLRNPRSWEDRKVDFTFNTPLITFRNLEVLAAWVERPDMLYRGRRRRTVHLSEQGPNSPDYSEASLRDQAACMAYAWKKLKHLDAIEAFQYHNWIDNRHEGGLRIGLRKFPGDEFQAAPKPVWFVYQKLDTDEEDEACAFAKDVIGIQDWNEVRHTAPIE